MNIKRLVLTLIAGLTVFNAGSFRVRFPSAVRASSGWFLQAGTALKPDSLALGQVIEAELKSGETNSFPVTLAAGDFFKLTVEPKGIDAAVRLVGSDGKTLREVNLGAGGAGTLTAVVEIAGSYRVEVVSVEEDAPAGRYELKVEALRAATPRDVAENDVTMLVEEAEQRLADNQPDAGLAAGNRALEMSEKRLGPEHSLTVRSLNVSGRLYEAKHDWAGAERVYLRALAVREKIAAPEYPDVAESYNDLGAVYYAKGDHSKAEPMFLRVLALREKALGPDHGDVADTLNNLGAMYQQKGDYAKAESAFRRALTIWEKVLGPDHRDVAASLGNLGVVYQVMGDYARAETMYLRALAVREKALGPNHYDVAANLSNLAALYRAEGDYARSETMYLRALTIFEKALGPEHPEVANTFNNLGVLHMDKADNAKAEEMYLRALALWEKTLGPEHPRVADNLNNLGTLYMVKGDHAKAEQMYRRSLAVKEKVLGPEHPRVGDSLTNLASLYRNMNDFAKAEPLYRRALGVFEKTLGPEHPNTASTLNSLGTLYRDMGDYAKAEPLLLRALAIREKALGPEHPSVALTLNNLSLLYQAVGGSDRSLAYRIRCNEADERDLTRNLVAGSERQKILYLEKTGQYLNLTVSLHAQSLPGNPEALRAALTVVLRRKGRALDAMTTGIENLRKRATPEDAAVLDELTRGYTQLSNLILKGPDKAGAEVHQQRIAELRDQVERLENQVAARNVEFRVQSQPVTLEAVQKAVPDGAALVEFASHQTHDAKTGKYGDRRYVVYVLGNRGEPKWADLGPAESIDRLVDGFRAALRRDSPSRQAAKSPSSADRRDARAIARDLDERIMRPVRDLIGDNRHLLVSPDGMLNVIPFAALVDERGKFLVERYLISYLTSGRDLLRLREKTESQGPPLVMADPDYSFGRGPRLLEENLDPLLRLIATAREAAAIRTAFPSAVVKTRGAATETVLKSVVGPQFLHVATHGYFLDAASGKATDGDADSRNLTRLNSESVNHEQARAANPLLRSWLFLAGANKGGEGDDDGTMTALEAARLNLRGTKLVTLSACDTGLGVIRNGDGVYGLRRALVLAGSETQTMSLWPVSDRGTLDLMTGYYRRLAAGEGRAEALRNVQLEMLKNPRRQHPFFWASFIQSGDWSSLSGLRPEAKPN